ncbi:MAG TPA: ATP-binding protein [Chryseosolibacter sp.]
MLIIVSGLPGSGKSFFASRLSKKVNGKYISSDLTRKMIDAAGQYAFEDKINVYEEMARLAGDPLRQGKTVVIDATFYRKEMRNIFFTLATLLHQKVAYFEIVADEDTCRERLSHPRLDSEADFSVYKQIKPQYESYDNDHLILESTKDDVDGMLTKAMDYIQEVNERT